MKPFILLVIILLVPGAALSHPGKTDRLGGHKCWKDCAEWGLDYKEYHLHDKDFLPIKFDKRGQPAAPPVEKLNPPLNTELHELAEPPESVVEAEDTRGGPELPVPAPQVSQPSPIVESDALCSDPVLLFSASLVLIALMLASRLRKGKQKS